MKTLPYFLSFFLETHYPHDQYSRIEWKNKLKYKKNFKKGFVVYVSIEGLAIMYKVLGLNSGSTININKK